MDRQYRADLTSDRLAWLSRSLGVSEPSLSMLGIGWSVDRRAYTFPMRDEAGAIIGIRLRFPDGRKLCITGSRLGIVAPDESLITSVAWLLVTEGESDCAAALDLGMVAIARPGCESIADLTARYIRRLRPSRVAIVSDSDAPGRRGASKLRRAIRSALPSMVCRIIYPAGAKDLRAWRATPGASRESLLCAIEGVRA